MIRWENGQRFGDYLLEEFTRLFFFGVKFGILALFLWFVISLLE